MVTDATAAGKHDDFAGPSTFFRGPDSAKRWTATGAAANLEEMASTPAYNLNYRFAADMRATPEDAASMQAYVDFLIAEVRKLKIEESAAPGRIPANVRALVKLLGEIGSYSVILRKPEVGRNALEKSLALIEQYQLGLAVWAVHTIRYGDVLCFQKDFLGAETAFRSVLELAERSPELTELVDFAWQHLGKLHFDEKKPKDAEACFLKALEIRKKKGVKELIDSTEFALRVLRMRK